MRGNNIALGAKMKPGKLPCFPAPSGGSGTLQRSSFGAFEKIDAAEDAFIHMLRFFVAESGLVDVQSFRNIMYVSKRWNCVATSTKLWSGAAGIKTKGQYGSYDSGPLMPRPSHRIRAVIFSEDKQNKRKTCRHSCRKRKRGSSNAPNDRIHLLVKSHLLNDQLIGFAKLGLHSVGSESICFKARERATGKIFAIRAPRAFLEQRDESDAGEGQQKSALEELAGSAHLLQKCTCLRNSFVTDVSIPIGVDIVNGYLLRWYDFVDGDLENCIQFGVPTAQRNHDPKRWGEKHMIPLPVIRVLLHRLLLAIESLHENGLVHRNLKPKHILIGYSNSDGSRKGTMDYSRATIKVSGLKAISISALQYENGETILSDAEALCYQAPEVLMGQNTCDVAADIWSVGCIFAEMVRGGKPLFVKPNKAVGTSSLTPWPSGNNLPNFDVGKYPSWQKVCSRVYLF